MVTKRNSAATKYNKNVGLSRIQAEEEQEQTEETEISPWFDASWKHTRRATIQWCGRQVVNPLWLAIHASAFSVGSCSIELLRHSRNGAAEDPRATSAGGSPGKNT
jgi:hypothetical protein